MSAATPIERRAVVLLSGGLDSATVAAIAVEGGFTVTALSFDYGQRHKDELAAAAYVATALGLRDHRTVGVDLGAIGGSALTSDALAVPKRTEPSEPGLPGGPNIPVTYVPARNLVFLSVALGLAEAIGAYDLFIGANSLDYSGYPDCRPAFVTAFEALANIATKAAVEGAGRFRVHAPLMHMKKSAIIRRGHALNVDYARTHSCYDPVHGRACGRCDACILRARGFAEAGLPDPTRYAADAAPPEGTR